jgi:Outer membrane cobalamin receptor protein
MGKTFGWNFELKPYVNLTKMFRFFNVEKQAKTGNVAELSVSYGLVFDHDDLGLRASIDVMYLGKQLPHYTSSNQVEFGGDTVIDLHLAKRLYEWPDKGRLILKADILNLTDKFYETTTSYPQEGRSFILGLRYEY